MNIHCPDKYRCYNCDTSNVSIFCEIKNVPVHSVLLMPERRIALNYPRGDIVLGFCRGCGFIFNVAFDPTKHEYSPRYEETQGFSPTFNLFHRRLAEYLIDKYGLYNKNIIEIGCGKGEFLTMLCELGENRGVGFDPGYISERNQSKVKNQITFIRDFYSEKYTAYRGDFICCKMTLEHIQYPANFVNIIRNSLLNNWNAIVFFQVPNSIPVLHELSFWDIYYEHCSYFSAESLACLFRKCGFDVIHLTTGYDNQYVMLEARLSTDRSQTYLEDKDMFNELAENVIYFSQNYKSKMDIWRDKLKEITQNGQRVVLWGSGSKGVSFLNYLGIRDEIEFVVDINPYKHNMYMPGTGQKIISPDFLKEYKPDIVIAMNPIYREEIQRDLDRMRLTPELLTV